jgi:hypothetical protein
MRTATLNVFPFAGRTILQHVFGMMLTARFPESYKALWPFMLICVVIATAAALLSNEKGL